MTTLQAIGRTKSGMLGNSFAIRRLMNCGFGLARQTRVFLPIPRGIGVGKAFFIGGHKVSVRKVLAGSLRYRDASIFISAG